MTEQFITLKDILDNPVRTLEVKGIGKVKIRDPTTEDRLEAGAEAKKDPRWNDLSEMERNSLLADLLALRMLVEPKISREDYYKSNSIIISNILSAVTMDYSIRFKRMTDKRSKEINDFLELMRESSPKNSIVS